MATIQPALPRRTRPRQQAFLPTPAIFLRPSTLLTPRRHLHVRAQPVATLSPQAPKKQYVPLHVHSDFSLLDGASQLPRLVSRAAELGVPALALTDHGVLYGAIELLRVCAQTGVKPIIGNEMYVVNDVPGRVLEKGESAPRRYHLIVLAKNTVGYRNLVKLTTMAHLHGKVGKGIFARPAVNKEQLFAHREGLIVSSACLGGEIAQAILKEDMENARSVAKWFRDTFGDDFYLEIQDHGSKEDKIVNPKMIQISKELGIKVIATNDSHFTSCLDAEAHDALICIQTGKLLTDENRLQYTGTEYFKSVEEMRSSFVDHLPQEAIDDALYNTLQVAEKVDEYDLFGETRIPDFPVPDGFNKSHDDYLRHTAHESLKDRLATRQATGLADPNSKHQYFERLNLELDMIARMGFSSYFLVVWDYIKHARELGIPVGPGRGSAAGSLVAFALRITDVDPIPFNLLFERFLNPERKSMPDIDTDFSVEGRERIISYVSERYGADRVAQIITFNRLTSKAVLKDVARVHSVPYSEADRLAKMIPVVRGKPATLSKLLSEETPSSDFKKAVDRNPLYMTWIDKAMRIEGTNKTFGIHAAGVVISASPLTDAVPLSKAKHGETITQYSMEDVESLGLLKMDFLGLKNLTVIEKALEFINQGRRRAGFESDLDFSVDSLPLDDAKTYKLLSEGELDGIFQLDASGGMRSIVRDLRPSSLEDISSILALYRPGPLDAGLIPKFIRRKHGLESIEYDHPLLEPILKETYGIMVYQEQIMRIARDLAGYSLGQADILRRAMGKKKTKDMERERPRFVSGAQERGVSEEKATELFDMMIKFAEYCFNKSHSTAYAYLTYQTAYLKANYPVEYSAALLRSNMTQSDKLVRYLADANVSGVSVLPPSVNKSDLGFTVDWSDWKRPVVLFGLEAVKTVGASVSQALLAERQARGPFLSILDLTERVDLQVLNKRAMGALIRAGAFDELHKNRKVLLEQLDNLLAVRRKLRDKKKRREKKKLSEEEISSFQEQDRLAWEEVEMELAHNSADLPDFPFLERLAGEKATMGFYASGHPLFDLDKVRQMLDCTRIHHIVGEPGEADNHEDGNEGLQRTETVVDGAEVMILSCITELKKMTTARGKKMVKWMIEDSTSRVAGIVFPGSYAIVEQTRPRKLVSSSTELKLMKEAAPEAMEVPQDVMSPGDLADEEESYVVEEDARVIVWGKVDRESSGTTQVIVDDVQRVEDVEVVVATAQYNELRVNSTHLQILQHTAAEILGTTLSSPSSGTYLNAHGEVKKRWPKKTDLHEKKRIPLVLRCLDEDGEAVCYMNAGNRLRFPRECDDMLRSLKERTGFEVDLMSIGSEFMGVSDEMPDRRLDSQEIEEHEMPSASTWTLQDSFLQKEAEKKPDMTVVNVEVESLDQAGEAERPSLNQTVVAIPSGITSETGDVIDRTSTYEGAVQEMESELSARSSRNDDGQEQSRSIGGVVLNAEQLKEHRSLSEFYRQARASTAQSQIGVMTWREKLAQHRTVSHKTMVIRESGTKQASTNRESTPDVAVKEQPGAEAALAALEGRKVAELPEAEPMSDISVTPENCFQQGHVRGQGSESVSSVQKVPHTENIFQRDRTGSAVLRDVDVAENHFQQDEFRPLVGETEDLADENPDPVKAALRDNVSASVPRSDISEHRAAEEASTFSSQIVVEPCSDDISRQALSDGLDVDFDVAGLPGVLDAICLVAGDLATSHCKGNCTAEAISGVDMSKISEEHVSVNVSGRLSFVDKQRLYVLVDMKEKNPSGKRKRARSFGQVVVLFKAEKEVDAVPCKTKKAAKIVESARSKMQAVTESYSQDDGQENKSDGGLQVIQSQASSFQIYQDVGDIGGRDWTGDGGQMLLWMSRAAIVGTKKILENVGELQLIEMDSCLILDTNELELATSLKVRVQLEEISSGCAVVRVETEALHNGKESRMSSARFRLRKLGEKNMKNAIVANADDALFNDSEVVTIFTGFVESLTL